MSDISHIPEAPPESLLAPFIKRKWLIIFSLLSLAFLYVALIFSRQHYICSYKNSTFTHTIMAPTYYREKEIHRKARMVCVLYSSENEKCEVKSCKLTD